MSKNYDSSIICGAAWFLAGALLLSLLAIPQKMILGADPFTLKGFIVPVFFGGVVGMFLGLAHRKIRQENLELKRSQAETMLRDTRYTDYFNNSHACMLLIDAATADIVDANPAACDFYGYSKDEITRLKISDINLLSPQESLKELQITKNQNQRYINFKHRLTSGEIRDVEAYAGLIRYHDRDLIHAVVHDITDRKLAEAEREQLISQLQEALAEIKTLSGLLPICASCKKIRDDKGYWQQIEEYIGAHSEAKFSHSICPQCMKILYPELKAIKHQQ